MFVVKSASAAITTQISMDSHPMSLLKVTYRLLVSILALGSFAPEAVRASDPVPPLATIIQKVVERDAANQKALQSLQYHQTVNTERVDGHDKVTQRQELQMIIRPGSSEEIQVISEKGDDLPTNPDEAALKAQGQKAQRQKVDFSLKDIVARFNISFDGTDRIQNQPVYVLAFEPKPNQPYGSQTEKVLNQLHGRIWVNAHDYSVLKTDATLVAPVEIAWVFAWISALSFHYELDNASGGLGPARIKTSVEVDAPLVTFRQRMTIALDQFVPRTKP